MPIWEKTRKALPKSANSAREAQKSLRLLFVDDQDNILLTLPFLIEKHGFDVTTVAGVADALVQISAVSFDVLLTGLNKIKARLSAPAGKPVRLTPVLMENEREITAKILGAIKGDATLKKARLDHCRRVDHIPTIFQAVIDHLMHEFRPFRARQRQFAPRHGKRRRKTVTLYRCIHACILGSVPSPEVTI